MGQVDAGDLVATGPDASHRSGDGTPSRTPTDHQQVGILVALDHDVGDRNGGDPTIPQMDHPLVVLRVVGDVAATVLLLETADPVHQVGRAGQGDGPDQVLVAEVRPEDAVAVLVRLVELGGVLHVDGWQVRHVGQPPRLGPVGQVAIRQEQHRRVVHEGDAGRLDGGIEAVRRRAGRHDRHRRLSVAPVHGHHQVGGLGLGGQPGRRSAPLDVHDHERELQAHRQAHRLTLQGKAGSAGGRNRQGTTVGGPDRRSDRCDLVLGLEGGHAEGLVLGQLVEDVGGGRDGIRAQVQGQSAQLGRCDEAP